MKWTFMFKVISFLKKRYPHSLFTVTLGENQDTVHKRINSFKKGYLRGSLDLVINNLHKYYTGFCIEFKSPKGNGVLSPDQSMILLQYQNIGFKTLVSNDYDHIIEQVIEYFRDVRIKCSYCPRRFISFQSCMRQMTHEADDTYSIRSTWSCYWLDQFLTLALNILILSIFYISMDLSTNYFAHFSGC